MTTVYDADGGELGEVSLTEKQLAALEGGPIAVLYHTPQLLHGTLGQRAGSFSLHKAGERISTTTVDALRDFLQLQAQIKRARGG